MRVSGPTLRPRNSWAEHQAMFIAILKRALILLREIHDLPEAEIDLNRELYWCLRKASVELYPKNEVAPLDECKNQPDPDDQARAEREKKMPDFQWIYLDRYERDPLRNRREFVVECKRLGTPLRASWKFNPNYTNHGIARFREPQWSYAKGQASGAMVGYWQSMEGNDILQEINQESNQNSLSNLVPVSDWNLGDITHLEHTLDRPFKISPFKLYHFWIDLRHNVNGSSN